jgi:hypothetical protein
LLFRALRAGAVERCTTSEVFASVPRCGEALPAKRGRRSFQARPRNQARRPRANGGRGCHPGRNGRPFIEADGGLMYESFSHVRRFASVVRVLPALILLGAVGLAQAQTSTTVRYKEVHYQFATGAVPLGNPADGRVHGVWTRRGLTMFDDGEVASYSALGDFDLTQGAGTISGTDTTFFADGSSWSTRFTGEFSIGPKGLWVIPHKGEFVGGSGRFAGISGTLTYTSRQVDKRPDFEGFAVTEGSATYTLPQK